MIHKTRKTVPSLGKERFFSHISKDVVARMDALAWHRQYEPRQIIFFPDDACEYVYWVRSGRVKITRVADNGREIAFRHLIRGDMFGEECLINSQRRNDYAEAIAPTLLTMMRSEDFMRVMREEIELCHAIAVHLCRRALDIETVLSEFVFIEVRQRVATRLWHMYRREGRDENVALDITHQEIANLVGAARETVTNVLNALRAEGIISLGNRRIRIVNAEQLRRLSEIGE